MAPAKIGQEVRDLAHVLGAAGDRDLGFAESNRSRREIDRSHRRAAGAIYGVCDAVWWNAGFDEELSGDGAIRAWQVDAGGHLLDIGRVNAGASDGFGEH